MAISLLPILLSSSRKSPNRDPQDLKRTADNESKRDAGIETELPRDAFVNFKSSTRFQGEHDRVRKGWSCARSSALRANAGRRAATGDDGLVFQPSGDQRSQPSAVRKLPLMGQLSQVLGCSNGRLLEGARSCHQLSARTLKG